MSVGREKNCIPCTRSACFPALLPAYDELTAFSLSLHVCAVWLLKLRGKAILVFEAEQQQFIVSSSFSSVRITSYNRNQFLSTSFCVSIISCSSLHFWCLNSPSKLSQRFWTLGLKSFLQTISVVLLWKVSYPPIISRVTSFCQYVCRLHQSADLTLSFPSSFTL